MNYLSIYSAGLSEDTKIDVNFSHLNLLSTALVPPSDQPLNGTIQEECQELRDEQQKLVSGNYFVTDCHWYLFAHVKQLDGFLLLALLLSKNCEAIEL